MKQKKYYMNYRTPADMHSDGVYFNEDLKARKQNIDNQSERIKARYKSTES